METNRYRNLSTTELTQITRERGLDKPDVLTAGEWADWLAEQDEQANKPASKSSASKEQSSKSKD